MQALLLSDDPNTQSELSTVLMTRGFHVFNAHSIETATNYVRRWTFDLLVMSERIDTKLTDSVALSAERHTPYISTLLLTQRSGPDLDEMYELLPSVYSILGEDVSPRIVGQLAVSAVAGAARPNAPVQRAISAMTESLSHPEHWVFFRESRPGLGRLLLTAKDRVTSKHALAS